MALLYDISMTCVKMVGYKARKIGGLGMGCYTHGSLVPRKCLASGNEATPRSQYLEANRISSLACSGSFTP